MKTLLLTQSEVRAVLAMDRAVEVVEEAFAAFARGEALMPAKVYLDLPRYNGDFRAMPSYTAGSAARSRSGFCTSPIAISLQKR